MFGAPAGAPGGGIFGGRASTPALKIKAGSKKALAKVAVAAPKAVPKSKGLGKGKGKSGIGYGKVGAKRMTGRKAIKETVMGVTKPAIRRLARRGGVKRLSNLVYEDSR